jgi:hypothetical protein
MKSKMKNELYYIVYVINITIILLHILLYNILLCENHNYKAQTLKIKCNTFLK